jgi:hypothetical protein
MDMTPKYLADAADAFVRHGFALTRTEAVLGQVEGRPCTSTKFELERGDAERLVLEVVDHPVEGHRYFMEIARFHGMRSFSFPLDSWKVRPTTIELKYYALADSGLGLSLTIDMAAGAPASPPAEG